jgi:LPS-assembly protein
MIAPPHLRALLGAALCCAPLLASQAADPAAVVGQSGVAQSSNPDPSCMLFGAPMLLAAATPNLAASDATPARTGASSNALNALITPGKLADDVSYSADQTTYQDGRADLAGDVDLHLGDREIQADKATYDRNTNSASASGKVRFRDPIVQVQGDTGHYGDDGAQFTHAQFQFLRQPGYGSADQIFMTPANVITLRHVTYTSCPPPRADWQIRARELTLDTAASEGVGRGASVDFKGVPILYLPWISFPLSDARKSGFLFPDISSSSRTGLELAVPWYWNIAPNQDATFTPNIYERRGISMDTQYRFLSADDSGSIVGDYLPHDSLYGAQRSYLSVLDRLALGGNSRLDTSVQNVSDTEYFEDFTQGSQSTSTPFLARSIAISRRDDIWNLRAQIVSFETLDDTLPVDERPYIQLPRLTAAAVWSPEHWPLLTTGLDSELVNFTRAIGLAGWRLDAKPQVGLDVSGPGYFMRPSLAWEFTQYELRDTVTADSSPQRSLPILDLDTGMEFERLSGSGGLRSITLEPRMMYVYIPYRNQSQLPVFDGATPDLNLIELFKPNRYVGIDRIGDANQLTVGLTTQMFENSSGVRYLSATVGEGFFFQRPRVTLPDQTLDSSNTSSLIAEINLTAYRHWNLQLNLASDPAISRVEQSAVILQYLASSKQVVNVGYRFQEGQLGQIDVSEAWRLSGRWDAYARAVYSLLDHQSIEDFAGFQFRGTCWSIRLVAQRSVSTRTGERDTGVSMQVELTGLSNVGNGVATGTGVNTFLEQSIRGYSASESKP